MASIETLAGEEHAPAGQIEGGGTVPGETVRRIACDAALVRITGRGELEGEISRASRTIPPALRRALAARDGGCVAEHCTKPAKWADAHHKQHWAHGGPTTMSNLILLCREHHRMVHEEGYTLQELPNGRFALLRPPPQSRSA
jgi:5-methylcytosine-specific restriction endonuclease McrA